MSEQTDFLLDETGDLANQDGDLVVGDASIQLQKDLIQAGEGEYKQNPTTGIGIYTFIDDEGPENLLKKIRSQLAGDNCNVKKSIVTNWGTEKADLQIDAEYK
ncbi:MAG: hypothetical protein PHU33_16465 [Bacteroidales bacterium]|nr:hypothetical protein [Bacteroidales bacterium]